VKLKIDQRKIGAKRLIIDTREGGRKVEYNNSNWSAKCRNERVNDKCSKKSDDF
jgi:hypothetical protein